jgi:hypothetical protein
MHTNHTTVFTCLFLSIISAQSGKSGRAIASEVAASGERLSGLKAYVKSDYTEAARHFSTAIKEAPGDQVGTELKIRSYADLARVEEMRGDFVGASASFRQALSLLNSNVALHRQLEYLVRDYQLFLKAHKMTDSKLPAMAGGEDSQKYIGVAWIDQDGTIRMRLRAPRPAAGHSLMVYEIDNPHYNEILAHLGPIRPGETVSVRPFE